MTLPVRPLRCDSVSMYVSILHLHVRSGEAAGTRRLGRAHDDIDWPALRLATRACCCPARPVVIVIMPPALGRPHRTDLLLCGHHYRASRHALAAAGASAFTLDGAPLAADTWLLAPPAEDPAPGAGTGTAMARRRG